VAKLTRELFLADESTGKLQRYVPADEGSVVVPAVLVTRLVETYDSVHRRESVRDAICYHVMGVVRDAIDRGDAEIPPMLRRPCPFDDHKCPECGETLRPCSSGWACKNRHGF
jgi:hypothetical protein